MKPQHDEEAAELQRLMLSMILFIGEVYVELAGHAAAARSVVQDMQGSATLLRSRSEKPGPRPQPWLAAPPTRRASSAALTPHAESRPRPTAAHLAQLCAHLPAQPSTLSLNPPQPLHTTSPPSGTPCPRPRHRPRAAALPSAQGALRLLRHPSSCGWPEPQPGLCLAQAQQQHSSCRAGQRQACQRASLNGSAAPRNSTTSPPAASIVNRDLRPTNLGGGAAFGVPAPAGSQQQRGAAVASGAPAGARPSGLARSASSPHESQAAAAAAAPFTRRLKPPLHSRHPAVDLAAAGRPVGPDSHPGGAAASLPSSGAGPPSLPPSFRRAVAAYDEAVAAGRQALLQEAEGSGPAGAQSPQQHVASCGRSYVSRLEARYGGGSSSSSKMSQPAAWEDPQTLLAAIVAAQTWLMQRQGQPVPLPEWQSRLPAVGRRLMMLKAAERWRNRFLRTLVGGTGHAAGSSPLQRTWQQALPCANTHTRDSADLNTGAQGTGLSPVSGAGVSSGTGAGSAARPLTYAQVLRCGASAASAAAHARSQLQLQWHLCQLAWEGGPASHLVPTHQDCVRIQEHMLQQHRLDADQDAETKPGSRSGIRSEMRSEASSGMRSGSGLRQQQQQQQQQEVEERDGSLREERWLARCRMAHMLLVKGAWNRHCCVSQPVEDESPEERQ
ncbi:MAG: hypothetical protein WDW38_004174 [Sanguina aurantia]